jgi:N-acetylglucosamine-6-sulfatase
VHRWLHVIASFAGLALVQCSLFAQPAPPELTSDGPNIVLIVTDDQRWDSLSKMPEVQRLLVRRGMTFNQAIVTNPLCCPSRATILTGRYSHTTGVYFNRGPHGGWNVFRASESSTIATALDVVGYRTALIGKYMNGYAGDEVYVPPGWDRWFAFTENPGYFDYTMFDSLGRPHRVPFGSEPEDYSTDVIGRTAIEFIRSTPEDTPFFLMVTPYAPHGPPVPAPRHLDAFADEPVEQGPGVGEVDVSDKPAHIQERGTADPAVMRGLTRQQWEMLLAVDELIPQVADALRDTGRAGNTLVIFTSDNGVSNDEHRWRYKMDPYEETIRVPLVISYPGEVPAGTTSDALVSNVDIAPTILDFAEASLPTEGLSMRPLITGARTSIRDSVVLEHVAYTSDVPTYCGIRTRRFTFARYATGEEELYDLVKDPWQLENAVSTRPKKTAALRALTESLCQPAPPGFSW